MGINCFLLFSSTYTGLNKGVCKNVTVICYFSTNPLNLCQQLKYDLLLLLTINEFTTDVDAEIVVFGTGNRKNSYSFFSKILFGIVSYVKLSI